MRNGIDEIKKWINKNGYPLEMFTSKIFKKNNFEVAQSLYYKDINTEKYREIDILAHKCLFINKVSLNISFVIECKKSDKPWVIFSDNNSSNIKYLKNEIFSSINAKILINEIQKNKIKSKLINPNISTCGYNIAVAFNEKSDTAYSATQSVLSACNFLVDESNKSKNRYINLYFPIIVIDTNLFISNLDENLELNVEEVNDFIIYNSKSFDDSKLNLISVVTKNKLHEYVQNLSEEISLFFKNYNTEINLITSNHPTNAHIKIVN
ncbi:hypothetical protein [Empedobacter falsenii]|uniref:NERD domain-containing protein n=1 Tax=Empedobacter falsenii TaxID=343874 RepID=A0AAW7DHD3_9FLAO|nr:hypothetical protein [Empedobacter falsenii]MDM1550970.1 hypothetical protein [Empedobacter falsenii]